MIEIHLHALATTEEILAAQRQIIRWNFFALIQKKTHSKHQTTKNHKRWKKIEWTYITNFRQIDFKAKVPKSIND